MDEEMETEASKLILDDVEDFGVGRSFWTLLNEQYSYKMQMILEANTQFY